MENVNQMRLLPEADIENSMTNGNLFNETVNSQSQVEMSFISVEEDGLNATDNKPSCSNDREDEKGEFDVMLYNYKDLGGELQRNLLKIKKKNAILTSTLNRHSEECEMLEKQRDYQQKILVNLQMKIENLNAQKIVTKSEILQETHINLQIITQEFESVFANDDYLRETAESLSNVLKEDKKTFLDLIEEAKQDILKNQKAANEYVTKMKELSNAYESQCDNLSQKLMGTDKQLEFIIEETKKQDVFKLECQHLAEEKSMKAKAIENEITATNIEIKTLSQQLTELEKECSSLEKSYQELKLKNAHALNSLKNKFEVLTKTSEETKKSHEARANNLNEIMAENSQLLLQIDTVMKEKEKSLQELENVNKSITLLEETATREKNEWEDLNILFKKLGESVKVEDKKVKNEEIRIETLKAETLEEINKLKKTLGELEREEEKNLAKLSEVKKINEELINKKLKNEQEISEAKNSLETVKKQSDETVQEMEKRCLEEEDRLDVYEIKLAKLSRETDQIDEEILFAENVIFGLDKELHREKQEQEKLEFILKQRNDIWQSFQEICCNVEEELLEIQNRPEAHFDFKSAENKLAAIREKYSESVQTRDEHFQLIHDSYTKSFKTIDEQMAKMKSTADDMFKKIDDQMKRRKAATSTIKVECSTTRNLLFHSMGKLLDRMNKRMNFLEELMEMFKLLEKRENATTSKLKTTINQHLIGPMKKMSSFAGMKVNLKNPSYNLYKQVFDKFTHLLDALGSNDMSFEEMRKKIMTMGTYLYGKSLPTNEVEEGHVSSSCSGNN